MGGRPLLVAALVLALGPGAGAWGHPGDAADLDHDTIANDWDNCPQDYNPSQRDNDADAVPRFVTEQEEMPNGTRTGGAYYGWTEGASTPGGQPDPRNRPYGVGGDSCDEDDDNDGFADRSTPGKARDVCPRIADPDQRDSDRDGIGDRCDSRDDREAAATQAAEEAASGHDKTAPAIAVQAPRTRRADELRYGIAGSVRCSEGCLLDAVLIAGRRRLGRGAASLEGAGRTYVFVKLSRAALRSVRRRSRLTATLRVTARDASGNTTVASRRVTLRR